MSLLFALTAAASLNSATSSRKMLQNAVRNHLFRLAHCSRAGVHQCCVATFSQTPLAASAVPQCAIQHPYCPFYWYQYMHEGLLALWMHAGSCVCDRVHRCQTQRHIWAMHLQPCSTFYAHVSVRNVLRSFLEHLQVVVAPERCEIEYAAISGRRRHASLPPA